MSHSHPQSPRSVWRTLQLANPSSFSVWRKLQLANPSSTGAPASGFTLVELLVVIGIIGLLTAISVPIVMQSLAKARNAAIKAEIDMLHMAIMNYRSEYGAFPPCADGHDSTSMTRSAPSPYSYLFTGLAAKHLKRLFPRCSSVASQLTQASNATQFGPDTAIFAWLSGYTPDPSSPLIPVSSRTKLYDFDTSRLYGSTYCPSGKPNSPYVYIDAASYTASLSSTAYPAQLRIPDDPTKGFANSDTFQILCAGQDGEFPSPDDLSNFWPGTRAEYEESLAR